MFYGGEAFLHRHSGGLEDEECRLHHVAHDGPANQSAVSIEPLHQSGNIKPQPRREDVNALRYKMSLTG